MTPMSHEEMDILWRALALRKLRKIGILWAEGGRYWISESEYDPFGSRVRISLHTLGVLVAEIEGIEKKPPAREGVQFDIKSHIAPKNISIA